MKYNIKSILKRSITLKKNEFFEEYTNQVIFIINN